MKAVMVMFDSLNRHMLPPYGCDWTHAPNFRRLARRSVTFERSYVCSMPCMPARRDLHTARPNFLHRSWGPLEPFDDSVPEMLKNNGIYTHLASDHLHYWEDGGCTYHNRYNSWEFLRGQEGDPCIGQVEDPEPPEFSGQGRRQDWVNRQFMRREELQPQAKTFAAGLDFMRRNHEQDNWFLQIETFDPHEPFFTQRKYKDLYPHDYSGPHFDWPPYDRVSQSHDQVEHCRLEYAALLSMCDSYLGDVLDAMDEQDMWGDTMLIVWTDHGFLLGEHEFWAKMRMPMYEEIAHTPFFVWDPRCGARGERRQSLVQPSLDLGPTLLDFFDLPATPAMLGHSLREVIASDAPLREAAIFGIFGGPVNVTDGRYVYLRAAQRDDVPLAQYTLMPTHMNRMFTIEELRDAKLSAALSFTKGCPVLQIDSRMPGAAKSGEKRTSWYWEETRQTALYDLAVDPQQQQPLDDPAVEQMMVAHLTRLLHQCDAPPAQFERFGLVAAA